MLRMLNSLVGMTLLVGIVGFGFLITWQAPMETRTVTKTIEKEVYIKE